MMRSQVPVVTRARTVLLVLQTWMKSGARLPWTLGEEASSAIGLGGLVTRARVLKRYACGNDSSNRGENVTFIRRAEYQSCRE